MEKNRKVLVLGNMSSGKSTFINSILKENILPTSNQACTSKEIKIIVDNSRKTFSYYVNNRRKSLKNDGLNKMNILNKDKEVLDITLKGPSVIGELNKFEIYDSPGPNNSIDLLHKNITLKMLEKKDFYKVIFLLNAGNLFTLDDKLTLEEIQKQGYGVSEELIIVINKIDKIHFSEENTDEEIIEKTAEFLENIGIKKYKIFLYSSLYFVLFKEMNKTKSQKRELEVLKDLYGTRKIREFKKVRKKIFL